MTTITNRWKSIIAEIKLDRRWEEVLEDYLKEQKLDSLPEPEWSDDPTMAFVHLPKLSLEKGDTKLERVKARMFPENIVGYLKKGGLMKLPAKVEASQRSQKEEQLPKMETEKPKPQKIKLPKIGEN